MNGSALTVEIAFDGGSRGNPGPSAAAAIVRGLDGSTLRHAGVAIDYATNNVAEWTGLLTGLSLARDVGATDVRIFGDSKLVIDQFSGKCSIHEPHLRQIAMEASKIARTFRSVSAQHVRREFNRPADAICNAVLDGTYVADGALPDAHTAPADAPAIDAPIRVAFMVEVTMNPDDVVRKAALGATPAAMRSELGRTVEGRLRLAAAVETGPRGRAKVDVHRVKG